MISSAGCNLGWQNRCEYSYIMMSTEASVAKIKIHDLFRRSEEDHDTRAGPIIVPTSKVLSDPKRSEWKLWCRRFLLSRFEAFSRSVWRVLSSGVCHRTMRWSSPVPEEWTVPNFGVEAASWVTEISSGLTWFVMCMNISATCNF
jgi:hypothetical protein